MIKLVVADFDGTLLPYGNKTLSQNTLNLIKTIVSKGVKFAVASGRTYSELVALMKDVADDIYFICDDGAVTVKNGKIVFKKQFSLSSYNMFFDDDLFKNATFYSLDKAYLVGKHEKEVLYGKTPCRIQRAIEIKEDIFKITATAKRFDITDTDKFRVHYAEGYFAEFVSPYANKGVALGDLQLKLGISKFDTIAIGDADNDIPMMSHAKSSWAIGQRSSRLLSVCTDTCVSAEKVLEQIVKGI